MLKRFLPLLLVLPVLISATIVDVKPAYAYSSYQDCTTNLPTYFSEQTGRAIADFTDSDRTAIRQECLNNFPGGAQATTSASPSASATARPTATASTTATPTASSSATASSTPTTAATQPASVDATNRPYGGFINDTRGVPTLDPQQYVNYYQGTSFSRLTSSRDAFGFLTSFGLSFIGMVAIIFLIYAGFIYITANGEQAKIDKAKKLIWGTVIGILIIFAVYAVVATLLNISAAVNPGVNIGPLNVGPGGTTLRLP